jgi:hypothetical protein
MVAMVAIEKKGNYTMAITDERRSDSIGEVKLLDRRKTN